jgi:hypothetical protein
MTERPSLFREEALEFRASQPQGGALRIDPPWTRWTYWVVLVLVVAGVVVVAIVRTSETTSGSVLIDVQERTFVALVPDAAAPDVRPGQLVHLHVNGADGRTLIGRVLRAKVADQARIHRAGFAPSSQPATLVRGVLAPQTDVTSLPASPVEGRADVVLSSRTILDLFLRQLRGALGEGGDS